jgi:hypothetical protein
MPVAKSTEVARDPATLPQSPVTSIVMSIVAAYD